MSILNKIKTTFDDFLSPPYCLINGEPIYDESLFFSQKGIDNFNLAPEPDVLLNRFIDNFGIMHNYIDCYHSLLSLKENRNYLNVIHQFKYYNLTKVAETLGSYLSKKIEMESDLVFDYIVPVPIHSAKKRERGYNQSTFIADAISKSTNIKMNESLVKRIVYTKSQTQLSSNKRQSNVEGIFAVIDPNKIFGKRILIVDDVITTGATINSLAKVLKEAEVKYISACSIAIS